MIMTASPVTGSPGTRPAADRPPLAERLLSPAVVLRAEGMALLVLAALGYAQLGATWWLFAALILAPDLGLLGYLAGPRLGARTYNLTHTLVAPIALVATGLVAGAGTPTAIGLVWAAHIGLDRAAGFGLKHPTHFRDTHLQRAG